MIGIQFNLNVIGNKLIKSARTEQPKSAKVYICLIKYAHMKIYTSKITIFILKVFYSGCNIYKVVLYICAPNDSKGDYIVKNVSLCKFGFKRKITHSSFQRCKTFHITRTITNKTDGNIPHVFVDFDMFYKSAHHFLYLVWRAWNTKLLAKCQ